MGGGGPVDAGVEADDADADGGFGGQIGLLQFHELKSAKREQDYNGLRYITADVMVAT